MGCLTEGALRVVDHERERADRVVLRIFVNPLQFGPGEDFQAYPRDLARDRSLAAARHVDCLFVPDAAALYPTDPLVKLDPGPLAATLEGRARPGHFVGVLTVVTKLFHWVEPDVAVFGRKDLQQALLVERLAADLDFPVEIDVRPTVRQLDALALSSRNAYLDADARPAALALSRALPAIEQAWRGGEADPRALVRRGMDVLATPGVAPEYLVLVDRSLRPVTRGDARPGALVAAKVASTPLIDNVVRGDGLAGVSAWRPCR